MNFIRGLLDRLTPRTAATVPPAPVHTLPDGPLYAVGDVHGYAAQYDRLEAAIVQDAQDRGEDQAHIVLLGDYVDRGPDSAGMLDRLCAPAPDGVTRFCLKGNHEVMFEAFLRRPDLRTSWLDMGGRETLASYGLYTDQMSTAPRYFAQMIQTMIPEEHLDFLASLPLAAQTSTHFLCHAGVDPDLPLDAQSERALLWMREPFLSHGARLERIVVHGHTPVPAPDVRDWRINVDTGAYSGGPLSAVRLDGNIAAYIVQTG